jgi:hypothetical protein
MKLLLFLLFAACVVQGVVVAPGSCPMGRNDIKDCVVALLDVDPTDATITAEEIDDFLVAQATAEGCLPNQDEFKNTYNSTGILTLCDADESGDLTNDDFVHADACLKNELVLLYMCRLCYMCGWSGPAKK